MLEHHYCATSVCTSSSTIQNESSANLGRNPKADRDLRSRLVCENQTHSHTKGDQSSDYLGHEAKSPKDLPPWRALVQGQLRATHVQACPELCTTLVSSANNQYQSLHCCPSSSHCQLRLQTPWYPGTENSLKASNSSCRHQSTLARSKGTPSAQALQQ